MEDKKANAILIKLLDKYPFNKEEKEAVLAAIGVLSWTSLAKSGIIRMAKARKIKLDKSLE